jgi:flagellar hook-length control protein FliK
MRLRIARDAPERHREQDATPWRQVRLDLALETLGRVHVRIGLAASQVQVEFLVEQAGAADRIEAGLGELSSALEGAGFAQVLSLVVLDPVTAGAPDDLPELPRGAIVDADA